MKLPLRSKRKHNKRKRTIFGELGEYINAPRGLEPVDQPDDVVMREAREDLALLIEADDAIIALCCIS